MSGTSESQKGADKRPVTVLSGTEPPVRQPEDFHLCPLGIQFHSECPLEPFTVVSVDIDAPDEVGEISRMTCLGAVVQCEPDKQNNRYRVWLQFLDLPEQTRENLRCTAKSGNLLCAYCENF
ncbi:MAG: PilZ domain-containing protein [Kiritimatiellae bacterium]|nr:PilZ domain-containing protein [Kiritimatiellia bacterium]